MIVIVLEISWQNCQLDQLRGSVNKKQLNMLQSVNKTVQWLLRLLQSVNKS